MMSMDISLIDKIKTVFKYFFSSFMPLELIIIVICVFTFLFLNLKRNKNVVNIFIPITILLFIAFIAMGFHEYILAMIEEIIKLIINSYYFPSMTLYFIMMIITTMYLIYNVYTNKISKKKKILNYSFSLVLFILFVGLFSYIIANNISLSTDYSIYKDMYILSFVQLSTLVFITWILVLGIIKLYNYFKRKYD